MSTPACAPCLDPAAIERFLAARRQAGLSETTLRRYRGDLELLCKFAAGRPLEAPLLEQWRAGMEAAGYSARSVSARLMTANAYLAFCGRPDLRQALPAPPPRTLPVLTAAEYARLLAEAEAQPDARLPLLIRLFAEQGLLLRQLPALTVEAVAAGRLGAPGAAARDLPLKLQWSLLRYARARGVQSGPVFASRTGRGSIQTDVSAALRGLALRAGLPPEKVTPRSLHRLFTGGFP